MKNNIALKGIKLEDFVQYKLPSMFLITSFCDWKCCVEQNLNIDICQNSSLAQSPFKEYSYDVILKGFMENDISQSVVIGGLEPFLQFEEVLGLIDFFRANKCSCDFVIYTGYNKEEIEAYITKLLDYNNIYIKFGRYIPNCQSHYDEVLGIYLASDNQYGEKIS